MHGRLDTLSAGLMLALWTPVITSTTIAPARHSSLVVNNQEYSFITDGETCEASTGWSSIYNADECAYAANHMRCNLPRPIRATCRGLGATNPCGCFFGIQNAADGSSGAVPTFAQSCGLESSYPCSQSKQCVCREPSGAFHVITAGTCTNQGFSLVQTLDECAAATHLVPVPGLGAHLCTGSMELSSLNAGDCANAGRGPKCSTYAVSGADFPGSLHYRADNRTHSNNVPWSCAGASAVVQPCSATGVRCVCKRTAPPSPPPSPPAPPSPPSLPPVASPPQSPPYTPCDCGASGGVSATPTSTCTSHGDPHYRTFRNERFDYYARGLFEHARFTISPCGCTVIIQSLLVQLTGGRNRANSANGATAVRVGTTTFTITAGGVVDVAGPTQSTTIQPVSVASEQQFGGCTLIREREGRGWAWRIIFPGNAGNFLVCACARAHERKSSPRLDASTDRRLPRPPPVPICRRS